MQSNACNKVGSIITYGKFAGAAPRDLANDDLVWIYRQFKCPDRELIRNEQDRRVAIRLNRAAKLRAAHRTRH